MKRLLVILAAAWLFPSSVAQKRAFTPADLCRITNVEDPGSDDLTTMHRNQAMNLQ